MKAKSPRNNRELRGKASGVPNRKQKIGLTCVFCSRTLGSVVLMFLGFGRTAVSRTQLSSNLEIQILHLLIMDHTVNMQRNTGSI